MKDIMNNITTRSADIEDLTTLFEFEQGIINAERPFDPTLKPGHINYYNLKELIEANDSKVIVAVHEGKVIGSGYIKILAASPYFNHSQYGYIGFMFVQPDYRGRGIIKMIINELQSWARSRNITEIRLDVYNENAPAIRSYEKAGFTRNLVNMRMNIADVV